MPVALCEAPAGEEDEGGLDTLPPILSVPSSATQTGGEGALVVFAAVSLAPTADDEAVEAKRRLRRAGVRLGLAFKLLRTDSRLVRAVLAAHGFQQAAPHGPVFNVIWSGGQLRAQCFRSLAAHQRVNHFPRSFELTRKDRLYRSVERMQALHGDAQFGFVPESFVTPADLERLERAVSAGARQQGPFIVKPVGSSRGRGIFLATRPDQIPLGSPMLVSRYLHDPLLLDGLKFDLRLYALVTSFAPLVAYLFHDGLARFATERYSTLPRHFDAPHVHLTNYSLNKRSKRYHRNTTADCDNDGHKWTLGGLLRRLDETGVDATLLMLRIEDVVLKTLLGCQSAIGAACRAFVPYDDNCFELFGFDVLVDRQLKPWLLEVNMSPSLSCDSPLDTKIKSELLCDALTLAGVPMRNPRPPPTADSSPSRAASAARRPPSAGVQHAQLLKRRAMQWRGRLVPLSRSVAPTERLAAQRRRVQAQLRRAGGFLRLFPRTDGWPLYGPFVGDLGDECDRLLHESLHAASGGGAEVAARARAALVDVQAVGGVRQLPLDVRLFLADSLERCRQYALPKAFQSSPLLSLPRVGNGSRASSASGASRAASVDVSDLVVTDIRQLEELVVDLPPLCAPSTK